MAGRNRVLFQLGCFFSAMVLSMLFVGQGHAAIGAPVLDKILMPGGETLDKFGYSVAVDGDTAIIGAPYDNTAVGSDAGSAHVFVLTEGVWEEQKVLVPDVPSVNEFFGYSVALDGDTAVVGSYGTNSAYVFVRSSGEWSQEGKLVPDDGAVGDYFGYSVAVNNDTVIVGSNHHNHSLDELTKESGSAYVFVRSNKVWELDQELLDIEIKGGDNFGNSVAVDGNTVIVGAWYTDKDIIKTSTGAAYIFTLVDSAWVREFILVEPNEAKGNNFGASVALVGDTALIGTSHPTSLSMGAAYIFIRSGGEWILEETLTPADGEIGDSFGISVSLDGDTAIVGAWYADEDPTTITRSGAAYIFTRDTNGDWPQEVKLVPHDGAAGQLFGHHVAISGNTALVGAEKDDELGGDAGAAYLFGPPCGWGRPFREGVWQMTAPPCKPDPTTNTVIDQLANDIGTEENYDVRWISFKFDPVEQHYNQQLSGDGFALGEGNWNFSYDGGYVTYEGTSTPVQDCTDPYGFLGNCFVIPLQISSGEDRWNMVGHPFPYAVGWDQVKIAAFDGVWTLYTPSAADGIVEKNFYRWTGNSYETWDDILGPDVGVLQPQESIWVRSMLGSAGYTELKLLIPAQ